MSVSDELYASYENGREAGIASAREAFDAERAAYEAKIIEIEGRRVDDAEIIADLEAENAKLKDQLAAAQEAVAEECAKIVEEPSGQYSIGHRRLPYWDGEAKAAEIRKRFGGKA